MHFTGELLASSSTERQGDRRWVEMELYKKEGGGYVLHRVGASRVYHVFDGPCNKGVRKKWKDVPEGSVPCLDCRPAAFSVDVDLEEMRHEINVCETAADVLGALITQKRSGPVGSPFLSLPAKRLLELAAEVDRGIEDATLNSEVRL